MIELVRHSLAMLRNPRLIVLHLVGNAVIAAAAAFWLLIPEAQVWQLLFAGISALAIVFIFLWIHSGTLAYAAEPERERFVDAFRPKISRLAWMAVGCFILFVCMRAVDGWTDSTWQTSGYVYSKAPSFLRPTSGPTSYANWLDQIYFVVEWYLLPCIFLPLIAARVVGAGALAGLRTLFRWKYWLATFVAGLIGIWLTRLIVSWTPGTTLNEQTVSLVLRFGLAYVLATAAWLFMAGVLGYFVGTASAAARPSALLRTIFPAGGENHAIVQKTFGLISDRRLIVMQLAACVIAAIANRASNDFSPSSAQTWKAVTGIVGGLLLLVAFLWAYAGTLAYASDPAPEKFRNAFRFRFGRMGWLLAGLVALLALSAAAESGLWLLNYHDNYVWLISRAISVTNDYLLPCLVFPWVAAKVIGNPFRDGSRPLRRWRYWVGMALLVVVASWISDLLFPGSAALGSLWTQVGGTLQLILADLPLIVGGVAAAGLVSYFLLPNRASANLTGQSVS